MADDRTVLLTGGTGFLGSSLLGNLIREGIKVIVLARPSSDMARIDDLLERIKLCVVGATSLEALFRENQVDLIIHCATNYGRREVDPIELLEANLMLPLKLLQLGRANNVSCFMNTDTILDKRISHYSLSKNQMKDWLKMYASDIACVNIALEHFYGPRDDETKFATHIIHSLLRNVDAIDLTAGEQKRDFIFIDDVVAAFMKIIKHCGRLREGFFHYEVGTGCTVAIREFVSRAKMLSGNTRTALNFGALPYRAHEVMESTVDLSEIQKLGWRPRYSLDEGLSRTIAVERDHFTSCES
jgi:CDP-paratose synthetase